MTETENPCRFKSWITTISPSLNTGRASPSVQGDWPGPHGGRRCRWRMPQRHRAPSLRLGNFQTALGVREQVGAFSRNAHTPAVPRPGFAAPALARSAPPLSRLTSTDARLAHGRRVARRRAGHGARSVSRRRRVDLRLSRRRRRRQGHAAAAGAEPAFGRVQRRRARFLLLVPLLGCG